MKLVDSFTSRRSLWWGALILSAVIIYPNIGQLIWDLSHPNWTDYRVLNTAYVLYFMYRYFFFVALTRILLGLNMRLTGQRLQVRFRNSFVITGVAYGLYVMIGLAIAHVVRLDCFTQMLILQFLIAWLIPVLTGHIYGLTMVQQEAEKEMEKLRSENLQSRVEALSNQINPHFFFNSLNGLTALVSAKRNEETLEYVTKLSNIFRYILQSDKRGLVRLEEELAFLDAYRYLLEVRYSGKLCFAVRVDPAQQGCQLPVLSLLPLVENVVKHNIIDSEHKMMVEIFTDECGRLTVTNPLYRKFQPESSHGIGLGNLSARYKLLMGADIEVKEAVDRFTVVLPLKPMDDECIDC
ncbi:MAG: histidine kinase [Tannerellaceae bacterium]|nr:histidine kinase [Tannerellaceae bacterium]